MHITKRMHGMMQHEYISVIQRCRKFNHLCRMGLQKISSQFKTAQRKRKQQRQAIKTSFTQAFQPLENRVLLSSVPYLAGMYLVDPNVENLSGQLVYLDFDGAQNVTYNGPVTIENIDVPVFVASESLIGHEQVIIDSVMALLNEMFDDIGVQFTANQLDADSDYSTIYVGGTDIAFSEYGSFSGLAEQVDVGNEDRNDQGVVFLESLNRIEIYTDYIESLASLVAHETGHLIGFLHENVEVIENGSDTIYGLPNVAVASIDSIKVYYTQDSENTSVTIFNGSTLTIKPDVGTEIDVKVYASSTAVGPYTYLAKSEYSNVQMESGTYSTSTMFYDISTASDSYAYIQAFSSNLSTGQIDFQIDWQDSDSGNPDLVVDGIKVAGSASPDRTFQVGQEIEIEAYVSNEGDVTTESNSYLGYYVKVLNSNGTVIKNERWERDLVSSGLDPGYSRKKSEYYTFENDDIGEIYFGFMADYRDDIDEGNGEDDDVTWMGPFTVEDTVGEPSPIVAVTLLDVLVGGESVSELLPGQEATVRLSLNNGPGIVDVVVTLNLLDSSFVYPEDQGGDPSLVYDSYAIGEDVSLTLDSFGLGLASFTFRLPDDAPAGQYTLVAAVRDAPVGQFGVVVLDTTGPGVGEEDWTESAYVEVFEVGEYEYDLPIVETHTVGKINDVGNGKAEQGITYIPNQGWATSSGSTWFVEFEDSAITWYDSNWENPLSIIYEGDNEFVHPVVGDCNVMHIGDISYGDGYVYAPLQLDKKGEANGSIDWEFIVRFDAVTGALDTTWSIDYDPNNMTVSGVEYYDGKIYVVEYVKSSEPDEWSRAEIHEYDVTDTSHFNTYYLNLPYINGIAIQKINEVPFVHMTFGGWQIDINAPVHTEILSSTGAIAVVSLSELMFHTNIEDPYAEAQSNFYTYLSRPHAEGLTFDDNGNLWVTRGTEVSRLVTSGIINYSLPPDTQAPLVTVDAFDVTSDVTYYEFIVRYDDNTAVDRSSIGDADLRVTGPNGYDVSATLVPDSITPSGSVDLSTLTATYSLPAPSGSWDLADNGTYTVAMRFNQVSDTSGNYVPTGDLGSFIVDIGNTSPSISVLPDQELHEDGNINHAFDLWDYAADSETSDSDLVFEIVGNTNSEVGITIVDGHYINISPDADWFGISDITVQVSDGSLATTEMLRITVHSVNDVPVFVKGSDIVISNDDGEQTASGWITDISAGPLNESSQSLDFWVSNNNNDLFAVQPTINSDGTLNYTPAAAVEGIAVVIVQAKDNGGTANGGVDTSESQTFTITVTNENEATSSLSGLVWEDTNGNGIQDSTESGLSGVSVYLDLNDSNTLDYLDHWSSGSNTSVAHSESFASAVVGTELFIFGGDASATVESLLFNADGSAGAWQILGAYAGTATREHAATVHDGLIYIGGGAVGVGALTEFFVYDPANDTYTELADIPAARRGHQLVTVGESIFLLGGTANTSASNQVWRYDLASGTWNEVASMTTKRSYAGASVVDGKIYIFGGDNNGRRNNTAEVYNSQTDSWSSLGNLPGDIYLKGIATTVVDGQIYLIGGDGGSNSTSSSAYDAVWIFDPQSQTYTAGISTLTTITRAAAVNVNDSLWLIGGAADGVASSRTDVLLLEPHQTTQVDNLTTVEVDETGTYLFTDLEAGDYVVRQVTPADYEQISPVIWSGTGELTFVQVLKDGIDGVNELDGAESVTVSPDGNHVYVVALDDNAVSVFSRDQVTGELTFVQVLKDGMDGINELDGASSVTVSLDGSHIYVAGGDAVTVFARDQVTGELSFVQVLKDGIGGVDGLDWANSVTVSPDGRHVYVAALNNDNAVSVFSRDQVTGELSFVQVLKDGIGGVDGLDDANSVIVSPDGSHVYVTAYLDASVSVFSRDQVTGELSFIQVLKDGVNGVDGLNYASSVTVSPDGNYVYISGEVDASVSVFSCDQATGELTIVQVLKDGVDGLDGLNGASSVIMSPDGSHVYVAAWDDASVSVFSRDQVTGELSFVQVLKGDINELNGANSVTVSPDGNHVYVAAEIDDTVSVFSREGFAVPGSYSIFVGPDQTVQGYNFGNVLIPVAPTLTSLSDVSIVENTTTVQTVTATDADTPGSDLVYSLISGADVALFSIDASTGELIFNSASDYETPLDADSDNVYEVTVQVSDGDLADTQTVRVTVTNEDEATSTLSGLVWQDNNSNGIQDSGESGIEGVTVYLDANDNQQFDLGEVAALTDQDGFYCFDGLFAGNYVVRELIPSNYEFTTPLAGQYGTISRVSVSSDRVEANGSSDYPAISSDGLYVAFDSEADNLVPDDNNDSWDIFVYNQRTGEVERISVNSEGEEGDDYSLEPSLSADSRYVSFSSSASNLVPGDTNGTWDIFVYDRQTGQMERVSVSSNGEQSNSDSGSSTLSADGRYVSFSSNASNLVSGDTNNAEDIFVYDRQTGEINRVSVSSDGMQGNSGSGSRSSISADARYVSFSSNASNLVLDDTNGTSDIFVFDRQTSHINRVSVSSDGTQGNGWSWAPSISADGRYVSYASWASTLVLGDTNDASDIFVYDRQTYEIERVSVSSDGTQGNAGGYSFISADGRYVSFSSSADTLVSDDTNDAYDIFVYDRQTGEIDRVSVSSNGTQGNAGSDWPGISSDGRYITFFSWADNLVDSDTNASQGGWVPSDDVFVYDRGVDGSRAVTLLSDESVIALDFGNAHIDSTAPQITINTLSTHESAPTLTGTVDDADAIIMVTIDGVSHTATNEGATWTLDWPQTLDLGTYNVQVTATDAADNVGSDTTTDELTITSTASVSELDVTYRVVSSTFGSDTMSDDAFSSYDSVSSVGEGDSFFVELWLRDTGDLVNGIAGGDIDLTFDSSLLNVDSLAHGSLFTLDDGDDQINNASGSVNDFGWGTLSQNVGTSGWVRFGYVSMTAIEDGIASIGMESGSDSFAQSDGTSLDWSNVNFTGSPMELEILAVPELSVELRLVSNAYDSDHLTDAAFDSYDSLSSVRAGQGLVAEVWLRDIGNMMNGIAGGDIDITFDGSLFNATALQQGSDFTLNDGDDAIDNASGRINNLGWGSVSAGIGTSGWTRLGYVNLTALEEGTASFDVLSGNDGFAQSNGTEIAWSEVVLGDLPVEVQVLPAGGVDVYIVLRLTGTVLSSSSQLPDSDIHSNDGTGGSPFAQREGSDFYVEVWVRSDQVNAAGISGGSVEMTFNAQYGQVMSVEHGDLFIDSPVAVIDNETGAVQLGGITTQTDRGDDEYVLLGRVVFQGQVPVDEVNHIWDTQSLDLNVTESSMQFDLVGMGEVNATVQQLPAISIRPMIYDVNDDGRVNFSDLGVFASAFRAGTVSDDSPPYTRWADFNNDGRVNFSDLGMFASAFRGGDIGTADVPFPTWWKESYATAALVEVQSVVEPQMAANLAAVESEQEGVLVTPYLALAASSLPNRTALNVLNISSNTLASSSRSSFQFENVNRVQLHVVDVEEDDQESPLAGWLEQLDYELSEV